MRAIDYHRERYRYLSHHKRFVRRVNTDSHSRSCPACRGEGGETDAILEDGSGPWWDCGFCEGEGKTITWLAMLWVRNAKEIKRWVQ
jgi:DnaJ-class molecular chaperone